MPRKQIFHSLLAATKWPRARRRAAMPERDAGIAADGRAARYFLGAARAFNISGGAAPSFSPAAAGDFRRAIDLERHRTAARIEVLVDDAAGCSAAMKL